MCVRVCNWRGCGTFEKVRAHMLTSEFWRGKLSLKQGGNKKWSDVEIDRGIEGWRCIGQLTQDEKQSGHFTGILLPRICLCKSLCK